MMRFWFALGVLVSPLSLLAQSGESTSPYIVSKEELGVPNVPGVDFDIEAEGDYQIESEGDFSAEDLAKIVSMDPDSPEFKRVMKGESDPIPEHLVRSDRPVIKHFRGSSKVRFPAPDSIVPQLKMSRKELLERAKEHITDQVNKYHKWLLLDPIPKCKKTFTDRIDRPVLVKGQEERVFYDMLFLSPEAANRLKKQRPDETVNMVLYDHKKPNGGAYSAKTLGLECLPFRMRATGAFLFYHYGDDALRRYGKDVNGVGEWFLEQEGATDEQ